MEVVHEVFPLPLLPHERQLPLGEPQRFLGLQSGVGACADGEDLSLIDHQDRAEGRTHDPEDGAEKRDHLR